MLNLEFWKPKELVQHSSSCQGARLTSPISGMEESNLKSQNFEHLEQYLKELIHCTLVDMFSF
jgi:hypothetical protein